jgi:carbamoyl-phosphate synthase large subunit
MPELKDKKVVIIGAGPNAIGQSGECDEGALEACEALSAAGCRVIAVDSNPDALSIATPAAGKAYIEPLTVDTLHRIIETERPDAILPAFGGRQSLHLTAQLATEGVLADYDVEIMGPGADCISRLLDREALKSALAEIGHRTPPIHTVPGIDAAVEKAQAIGFPVVLRCSDADRMPDGILAYNPDELRSRAARLPVDARQLYSVEASLHQWRQAEVEILRDAKGETSIAGCVDYLDSAGIHPGDSLAVSPPQSMPDAILGQLERNAETIANHLAIVGGATIRFAYTPDDKQLLLLAVHPRYTRTTALVARVSDRPLGKASALLAAGYDLKGIDRAVQPEGVQPPPFTAIAVKWPCWDFDGLDKTVDRIGPQMQALGQWISLGGSFKEAFQKGARTASGRAEGMGSSDFHHLDTAELLAQLATPSSRRIWLIVEALRQKVPCKAIVQRTRFCSWFIDQLAELIHTEQALRATDDAAPDEALLRRALSEGFGNAYLSKLTGRSILELEQMTAGRAIELHWTRLGGAKRPRLFSTYARSSGEEQKAENKSLLIIGGGAHRIGQGPDCDYGAYRAAVAADGQGHRVALLNCNLTSATTGLSAPAAIYCEPMTTEDILAVIRKEQPTGVVTQFAGLLADHLTLELSRAGIPLLGTPAQTVALLQNRDAAYEWMRSIGIPQPAGALATSHGELLETARTIGFPLLVRPASRTSKTTPRIVRDESTLAALVMDGEIDPERRLFIEQFLEYGIEAQAETLCDGTTARVAAVLEHVELAGVHAGDSASVLPPYSIAPRHIDTIEAYCHKIALSLAVRGLVNLRFAIYRDTVYLLEAVCHATRNLSVVETTLQLPLAAMAMRLMTGEPLDQLTASQAATTRAGLRAAVFPFNVFPDEDPLLGPDMRSSGQVLATADTFGLAYFKALASAGTPLPTQGTVLITVTDEDKASILEPARIFQELGFNLMATRGTRAALADNGIDSQAVRKLGFGRPDLVDEIKNGNVQMVINTPTGGQGQIDDSLIRKAAIQSGIANITTPASALAAARGIAARREGAPTIEAIQRRG